MKSEARLDVGSAEKRGLSDFLVSMADDARLILRDIGKDIDASAKTDRSLVTAADKEIEKRCRERIEQVYPNHGIIGEEFGVSNAGASFCWILDPVDGTEEFVAGTPLFGSIMALHVEGRPLAALIDHSLLDLRLSACFGEGVRINNKSYEPQRRTYPTARIALSNRANFMRVGDESALHNTLLTEFSNSRIYSSCYAHSCTVTGGFDALVEWNVSLWDVAASELLIVESGGKYVDVTSSQAAEQGRVSAVFGAPQTVDQICSLIGVS